MTFSASRTCPDW